MKNEPFRHIAKFDRYLPPVVRDQVQTHRRALAEKYFPDGKITVVQEILIDHVTKLAAFAHFCGTHENSAELRKKFEASAQESLDFLEELWREALPTDSTQ